MTTTPTETPLDLAAVAAAAQAATDGPWATGTGEDGLHPWEVILHRDLPALELEDDAQGRANATFIASARTWVPRLVAETAKLRTALTISIRSNVMCRHRLATTADEVAEHLAQCTPANAAMVAHEGDADEPVTTMLAQGWRLGEHVEYLAGKRIRILHGPAAGPYAVVDDPGQEITRLRAQIAAALDACDRMMTGNLSPSYIVAAIREALGADLPEPAPAPKPRPFIGCRLPCGPGKWCSLKICHEGDCVGVDVTELPPSADDPEGAQQ